MNKYIYIFVEVGRRELDARLVLAAKLAEKGYKVFIGEKNQLLWDMIAGRYPPGVILDKCAQIATGKFFKRIISKGFKYTVMDEEGLITSREYFNNVRFSREAEKYVDANFMVCNLRSEELLSQYPNTKNIVVGNPRYSMLRPEWKYWFKDEYENIKKKYGKFILIVSSFNPYPKAYDDFIDGMEQIDNSLRSQFENFVEKNKNTGVNFVYRPHPSDKEYKNPNVIVDCNYNIIPWIMACEYIINAKCTTSLEAFIAGKRAYTWKFSTKEKAYKIANLFADELSNLGTPLKSSIIERRSSILHKMIEAYDDPFFAVNKICETIEGLTFSTDLKVKKFSITPIIHAKNKIRFFIRGDDYNRIVQKFSPNDINYAYNKLKTKFDKLVIDRFVLEIN